MRIDTSMCWRRKSLPAFYALSLILLTGIFFPAQSVQAAVARVDMVQSRDGYPPEGEYPVAFSIHIASPWYIHATEAGESGLYPTRLTINASPHIQVKDITFPAAQQKTFSYAEAPVAVYSGNILVRATLVIEKDIPVGMYEINGALSYQACSEDSCLPPEKVLIPVQIPVVSPETPVSKLNREVFVKDPGPKREDFPPEDRALARQFGAGLWLTLLGVFLGGLALNLTPCIYPLIPITVSYFGGSGDRMGGHTVIHGVFYILGLAFTNSILGLAASLSGNILGAVLQNPIVLGVVAGILVTLAFSFFGFWELRIPAGLSGLAARRFGGILGTFFMGLTLGIVAAPCLGPFILGLLTYVGQKGDPFLGFLYFFVLSIGMGLPLAVLAVFSGAVNKLPVSGVWMVWIRKALGWVLMGMAGYLLQPLIHDPFLKQALLGLILLAAGLHLGWLDKEGKHLPVFSRIKKLVGVILVAGAFILPLMLMPPTGDGVDWVDYSSARLTRAVESEKPVMIDFYADWCGPCKTMDRNVFTDPQVVKLSRHFVNLRVDLTTSHPEQEKLQAQYRIRGVPTVVFMDRKGKEVKPLRIESYVPPSELIQRMKQLVKPQ
ncbi:MAG: cytochrome c biogenesis protein CcdA [Thermodesulfobacteriota bacterium]